MHTSVMVDIGSHGQYVRDHGGICAARGGILSPGRDILENKRFTKNDSGFLCANCGREVPPLRYTSRNHCPWCLCSLHLDVNPGDRAADCGGIMDPITAEPDPKRGFILTHKCRKCGAIRRNKAAEDDDRNAIIRLTAMH